MKFEFLKYFTPRAPQESTPHEESDSIGLFFHLITISITCITIYLLVRLAIMQPTPMEERFRIQPLTPQKIGESSNLPTIVRTGLFVHNFREFDLVSNSFVFEGIVWFEFDPSLVSLDTISNFGFEKGEMRSVSAPKTKLIGKRLLVRYDIVVKFSTELNYELFPLDDHMLTLVLINKNASPHELIFDSDTQEFVVDATAESYGWVKYFHQVSTGYIQESLDSREQHSVVEHPAAQFSIFYARSGLKYALILLMPMLVFIIIMLTAFSYDATKNFSSIMVANGASLSGLIGFRFVIENMSPKVGYFMISDYFFLTFLTIAALLFLIGIFSANLSMRSKKIIILLVHLSLITSFALVVRYVLSFSFDLSEVI